MAAVAQRPTVRRNSPLGVSSGRNGLYTDAQSLKRIDYSDSDSDDEPPPALKFSKVTQALLADEPAPSSPPKQQQYEIPRFNRSVSGARQQAGTPSRAPQIRIVRKSSPAVGSESRGSTPHRVVQVGPRDSASAKRSVSVPYRSHYTTKREPTPTVDAKPELITPAPAPRALRVRTRSTSNASQDGYQRPGSASRPGSRNGERSAGPEENDNAAAELNGSVSRFQRQEALSRYGTSTVGKPRNPSADPAPPPGSTRVKRAPNITGSFLRSGPVRRGLPKRRDSEDNISPADEVPSGSASNGTASNYTPRDRSTNPSEGIRSRSGSVNTRATSVEPSVEPVSRHDFAARSYTSHEKPESRQPSSYLSRSQTSNDSRPVSRSTNNEQARSRAPSIERPPIRRQTSIHHDEPRRQPSAEPEQRRPSVDQQPPKSQVESKALPARPALKTAQYRYVPPPKIHTDASEDQENMPPPTFKRNKDQERRPAISILSDDDAKPNKPRQAQADETPVPTQQHQQDQRKALGAISGNTPHRAAPAPPPKMSVIDTATTTAGASVTKSKKKRNHMVVNGKIFTTMGTVGKGGSSVVYCVMAENYKMFALKRVKLHDQDESSVMGFKGEIDLLKKLTEVERVVRLFDYEINNEKQELLVLMEKGDTDLNRLLTLRLNGEGARFDPVFTRYHWREMLECVAAVHQMDIVHSDLKPANFLLVQGRLKLIDFGIANAIDTDNTVNVHRDTHVGTPNYMSPESITDTSSGEKDAQGRPLKKDMRIGKASDVWSLGCILYQMAYGRPPFAHIAQQFSRIMAITNPKHEIQFPSTGVGGAHIPPSLRGCLRRCLNRNPDERPTIAELLSESDAYMNPEREDVVLLNEDLLGQIIGKVVERCRDGGGKRGFPADDEVRMYPKSFMEKIWGMVEKGGG